MMDNSVIGSAEKLKQLKQLLDIGAITQEEFDYKKEALLNPDKETKYLKALELIKSSDEKSLSNAVMLFNSLGKYHNTETLLIETTERAEKAKNKALYNNAIQLMEENTIVSLNNAINKFRHITNGYDVQELITSCEERIVELKQQQEEAEKQQEEAEKQRKLAEEKQQKIKKRNKIIIIIIIIIAIFGATFYSVVILPKQKLNTAMTYLDSGDYENAYELLEELEKDDIIAKNKYDRAMEYINNKDYDNAYALLKELGDNDTIAKSKYDRAVELIDQKDIEGAYLLLENLDYKDSKEKLSSITQQYKKIKRSKAKVGDTVTFGTYEKEEVEWQVLAKEDNRVLVITKNIIECKQYNTEYTDVTWESCTLRKWLNNDFYNKAFSDEEKASIQTTNVVNKNNAKYGTKGGNDTQDKVFLLSIDEANQYFTSDSERQCQGTNNAKSNELYVADYGNSRWWLRSPGLDQDYAACIYSDGDVLERGNRVGYGDGVRPAMWISVK